jgi:HD-GYP domain-containing protein (c-di-GMP phosphodiesterase class II)
MTRQLRERGQLVVTVLLLLPTALFFYLRHNPNLDRTYKIPVQHFYIVSATSLAALTLAIVVGIASVRSRAPRTFLVAAGFLAIAGIFSVHGLSTPGEHMFIKESHHSIAISARLSLLIGGLCFFLSTLNLPARVDRFIAHNHGRLLGAAILLVALYIGANLAYPSLLDFIPTGQSTAAPAPSKTAQSDNSSGMSGMYGSYGTTTTTEPTAPPPPRDRFALDGQTLSYSMAIASGLFLLVAAWRYRQIFTLSLLPGTGAMAVGMLLLSQSQISMTLGTTWRASWWLYHVLMLFGFLIPIAGIGWAYRRGSNLSEIVEGLFIRDALAQIERSFPEAMDALIAATVAKDPYLRGHSRRVCELTVAIGEELGLSPSRLRAASYGALLHDIGKIGIPAAVLQKPGRLSDDEFAVLKEHPMRGWHIVSQTPSLREAAPAIRWHHERLDGTGYPDHLAADQIPLEARIVAVADVWDALTSDRVYRNAWTPTAARDLLTREAGPQLDPRCVGALFAVLDRNSALRFPPHQAPIDEQTAMLLVG